MSPVRCSAPMVSVARPAATGMELESMMSTRLVEAELVAGGAAWTAQAVVNSASSRMIRFMVIQGLARTDSVRDASPPPPPSFADRNPPPARGPFAEHPLVLDFSPPLFQTLFLAVTSGALSAFG